MMLEERISAASCILTMSEYLCLSRWDRKMCDLPLSLKKWFLEYVIGHILLYLPGIMYRLCILSISGYPQSLCS